MDTVQQQEKAEPEARTEDMHSVVLVILNDGLPIDVKLVGDGRLSNMLYWAKHAGLVQTHSPAPFVCNSGCVFHEVLEIHQCIPALRLGMNLISANEYAQLVSDLSSMLESGAHPRVFFHSTR